MEVHEVARALIDYKENEYCVLKCLLPQNSFALSTTKKSILQKIYSSKKIIF
jgi:hypothetical protein